MIGEPNAIGTAEEGEAIGVHTAAVHTENDRRTMTLPHFVSRLQVARKMHMMPSAFDEPLQLGESYKTTTWLPVGSA